MTTTTRIVTTIVTSKTEREGDVTGIPVTILDEKETFDTDAQADSYNHDLRLWLEEFPKPSNEVNLFPRRKVAPTEDELFAILDKIHGPKDLWFDTYVIEEVPEVLDVPSFMKENGDSV